ncbi:NADH-quinone oxidoreductase subunit L [Pedobacter changchengzhani]|uniref:NADH-quinone oxidoreductase subunit L n=1 Tax=Pedobacter changchengzhani TaxID=2529274 RepID=A0A4V3A0H5_9SPHI|nr:NADH-quinone oxidoreductase subunit L [Pedobacter changchengzhani]TDG37503.1 NADH-quinone oxidoreductase subunit L [Pedobacter changchengzhani]
MEQLIWLVPLLPLLGFVINGLGRNFLSKSVIGIIGSGVILASFIISVVIFFTLQGDAQKSHEVFLFDWISAGKLHIPLSFLVDPLSSVMLLIITGIGFLIHLYSVSYMHADECFGKFFSYLNLFVFFMLILVLGANYIVMFIGWEGVGLCSYLLIGFWYTNSAYASAAKKAFVMNRIGDLGFLLGVFLMFNFFGSVEFSKIFPQAANMLPGNNMLVLITMMLFIGACGKSAQLPLFTWLPDAMAGPTPVSALIHAATMVTAGIYMIARSSVLFDLAPFTQHIIAIIGAATALIAAIIALSQTDIKKVLAYSTVSQLGYMFLGLGVGAYTGSFFHVLTHAFFKALLFLGAGSVIHAMHHEQDMRNMGGLRKKLPITFLTMMVATIAISGIPPFSGFFSKDEILAHTFQYSPILWGVGVLTAFLTAFYMFRMMFLTFFGNYRSKHHAESHVHESPVTMTAPLIILAILSAIGGAINIPHIFGGNEWLAHWLSGAQVAQHELNLDHTTEIVLMAISVLLAIGALIFAYFRYVKGARIPALDSENRSPLVKISYNKFYLDEIYDFIITKPLDGLSKFFYRVIDTKFIDGIVNGLGWSTNEASKGVRLIQSGNIGFYIFMMVFGIVALLAYTFYYI